MRRVAWLLPVGAVCLVAAVLAVYLAAGGRSYGPDEPADPCAARAASAVAPEVEAVAERVVLRGLDAAACELGVTRERMLLALASRADQDRLIEDVGTTRPELAATLRDGVKTAVARLEQRGELPKVSAMLPDIVEQLDLGAVGSLAERLPDGIVDGLLPTGAVLTRAADEIDYDELLANPQDPDQLETSLREAIEQGALDEARAQITDRLDLLGIF